MMLSRGSGGSPSPAHRHRNPTVRLDLPRVALATPSTTIAPPSVQDHEEGMTVVSASPADPPATSLADTVAPLLPVSLAMGPAYQRARAGVGAGRGRGPRTS
jgi:hypothetical protein